MKRIFVTFLILSVTVCYSYSTPNVNRNHFTTKKIARHGSFICRFDFLQQDRTQIGFDNMMNELTRVHKAIYSLPYEFAFIKNTIMVEVENNKAVVAPHYPNRSSYGEDAVLGKALFKEWYINYPSESAAYIGFADQIIIKYSKP